MQAAHSTIATVAVPVERIPFRPDDAHSIGDYAITLAITLLALVAMVALAVWLQRRGALPFGKKMPAGDGARVLDRVRLSRTAELTVVEHQGLRIAVVESTRGVAVALLPASRHDDH
jgi:hypothetical protein